MTAQGAESRHSPYGADYCLIRLGRLAELEAELERLPGVLCAVHRLRAEGKRVVVTAKHSTAIGPIVWITDSGFGLGDGISFAWPMVLEVREQSSLPPKATLA